ncbi:MAG: alpha/beta fold hydrolase [Acidimicrobiales bacterium]
MLDWPHDVAQFADRFGIDQFAVGGISAGCPYALACGVTLTDRLTRVGIIAGVLPPDHYDADQMAALVRTDPPAARRRAREHIEALVADVEGSVAAMATKPEPDGPVYARPDVQAQFLACRREAVRSGIEGPVHDVLLLNQTWGFELDEVTAPVRWWHGDLDYLTSPAMLDAVLGSRRTFAMTIYRGEGHAIGVTHGEEILAELVP